MKNHIIGHRGAGILAPENTLFALKVAKSLGLKHVEFDVRLTKDHVPVISHDDNLQRCAHINQLISASDYEDIKNINIAQYYAIEDFYASIPTLASYISEAQVLGLHCQIELKPNLGEHNLLVEKVCPILDEFYSKQQDKDLPLITSFVPECLQKLKILAKQSYNTGILVKIEETTNWGDLAQRSECDYVHLHALYLKEDIAWNVLNSGYQINAFHLNHPDIAKKAIERGCQKFTCDIPDIL